MNKYEYKIEFECDFKDVLKSINKVTEILKQELGEYAINITPTFTIINKRD
jgi:hypothetical protein